MTELIKTLDYTLNNITEFLVLIWLTLVAILIFKRGNKT